MAIKLGELLLQENLITPDQLDEALKCQTIFGIKLGSSLIELGFITDEQLCRLLSSKLGVPAASSRAMSALSHEVISHVPAQLASKYRVVPIRLDGKKLALAMADPTDFKAADEVAFVTGFVIVPYVAPDVRITSALSEYYHVRGDVRYLMAEDELAKRQRAAPAKKAEKIVIPMINTDGELQNIEFPTEFEGFAAIPGYGGGHIAVAEGVQQYSADQLLQDFISAGERDQIGSAFIRYLGPDFATSALFIMRNNMAVGWCGATAEKRIEGFETFTIPLDTPSVMKEVNETCQFFLGTLEPVPEHSRLLKILGVDFDTTFLALPIIMQKKAVAVLLVSGDMSAIETRLQELQKLARKASLAFEILILKNKILQT
jgi:hypothetical protein